MYNKSCTGIVAVRYAEAQTIYKTFFNTFAENSLNAWVLNN